MDRRPHKPSIVSSTISIFNRNTSNHPRSRGRDLPLPDVQGSGRFDESTSHRKNTAHNFSFSKNDNATMVKSSQEEPTNSGRSGTGSQSKDIPVPRMVSNDYNMQQAVADSSLVTIQKVSKPVSTRAAGSYFKNRMANLKPLNPGYLHQHQTSKTILIDPNQSDLNEKSFTLPDSPHSDVPTAVNQPDSGMPQQVRIQTKGEMESTFQKSTRQRKQAQAKTMGQQLIVVGQYINKEPTRLSIVPNDSIPVSKSIDVNTAYIGEATEPIQGELTSDKKMTLEPSNLVTNPDDTQELLGKNTMKSRLEQPPSAHKAGEPSTHQRSQSTQIDERGDDLRVRSLDLEKASQQELEEMKKLKKSEQDIWQAFNNYDLQTMYMQAAIDKREYLKIQNAGNVILSSKKKYSGAVYKDNFKPSFKGLSNIRVKQKQRPKVHSVGLSEKKSTSPPSKQLSSLGQSQFELQTKQTTLELDKNINASSKANSIKYLRVKRSSDAPTPARKSSNEKKEKDPKEKLPGEDQKRLSLVSVETIENVMQLDNGGILQTSPANAPWPEAVILSKQETIKNLQDYVTDQATQSVHVTEQFRNHSSLEPNGPSQTSRFLFKPETVDTSHIENYNKYTQQGHTKRSQFSSEVLRMKDSLSSAESKKNTEQAVILLISPSHATPQPADGPAEAYRSNNNNDLKFQLPSRPTNIPSSLHSSMKAKLGSEQIVVKLENNSVRRNSMNEANSEQTKHQSPIPTHRQSVSQFHMTGAQMIALDSSPIGSDNIYGGECFPNQYNQDQSSDIFDRDDVDRWEAQQTGERYFHSKKSSLNGNRIPQKAFKFAGLSDSVFDHSISPDHLQGGASVYSSLKQPSRETKVSKRFKLINNLRRFRNQSQLAAPAAAPPIASETSSMKTLNKIGRVRMSLDNFKQEREAFSRASLARRSIQLEPNDTIQELRQLDHVSPNSLAALRGNKSIHQNFPQKKPVILPGLPQNKNMKIVDLQYSSGALNLKEQLLSKKKQLIHRSIQIETQNLKRLNEVSLLDLDQDAEEQRSQGSPSQSLFYSKFSGSVQQQPASKVAYKNLRALQLRQEQKSKKYQQILMNKLRMEKRLKFLDAVSGSMNKRQGPGLSANTSSKAFPPASEASQAYRSLSKVDSLTQHLRASGEQPPVQLGHKEIDLKHFRASRGHHHFSDEEVRILEREIISNEVNSTVLLPNDERRESLLQSEYIQIPEIEPERIDTQEEVRSPDILLKARPETFSEKNRDVAVETMPQLPENCNIDSIIKAGNSDIVRQFDPLKGSMPSNLAHETSSFSHLHQGTTGDLPLQMTQQTQEGEKLMAINESLENFEKRMMGLERQSKRNLNRFSAQEEELNRTDENNRPSQSLVKSERSSSKYKTQVLSKIKQESGQILIRQPLEVSKRSSTFMEKQQKQETPSSSEKKPSSKEEVQQESVKQKLLAEEMAKISAGNPMRGKKSVLDVIGQHEGLEIYVTNSIETSDHPYVPSVPRSMLADESISSIKKINLESKMLSSKKYLLRNRNPAMLEPVPSSPIIEYKDAAGEAGISSHHTNSQDTSNPVLQKSIYQSSQELYHSSVPSVHLKISRNMNSREAKRKRLPKEQEIQMTPLAHESREQQDTQQMEEINRLEQTEMKQVQSPSKVEEHAIHFSQENNSQSVEIADRREISSFHRHLEVLNDIMNGKSDAAFRIPSADNYQSTSNDQDDEPSPSLLKKKVFRSRQHLDLKVRHKMMQINESVKKQPSHPVLPLKLSKKKSQFSREQQAALEEKILRHNMNSVGQKSWDKDSNQPGESTRYLLHRSKQQWEANKIGEVSKFMRQSEPSSLGEALGSENQRQLEEEVEGLLKLQQAKSEMLLAESLAPA